MNKSAHITILMDNNAAEPSMLTEHGLSLWIEVDDKRILWDTGQSDGLFDNARRLGIDISTADAIALSHGHYDHTGGLAKAIESAPNAVVYLHPGAMESKYSQKNGVSRAIGMSQDVQRLLHEKQTGGGLVFVDRKTELSKGINLTGPVPRHTPFEDTGGLFFTDPKGTVVDTLPDDQSLFFECPKGIVVILGCAHSGVVNVLDAVARWTDSRTLYAVIGGMHLVRADTNRLHETIRAFQWHDIQYIAPLHCTGSQATQQLEDTFGDRCLLLGTGARLRL